MHFRRQILIKLMHFGDLLLLGMSFLIVLWVFYAPNNSLMAFEEFLALRIKIENFLVGAVMVGIWHVGCASLGLYESKRLSTIAQEVPDIIKATLLVTFVTAGIALLFRIDMVSAEVLLSFWILSTVLICLSRVGVRVTLAWMRRKGRNLRNILIIGTNPRALAFAKEIQSKPELGYCLLGYVDEPWDGLNHEHLEDVPILTDLKKFPGFIRTFSVDEVLLALPFRSFYQEAAQVVAQCEEQGILVRVLGDLFSPKLAKSTIDEVGLHPTFSLNTGAIGDQAVLIKRAIDLIIAIPSVILLLPFFAIVAAAIKLSSPGPVFFIQERVGLNKRLFPFIKFRTMVPDAELQQAELEHLNEVDGAAFKITNDPRVTPLGRLLRKASIDELPQLINVINGDMSLVGPRPLPVRDLQEFYEDWHRRRFSVRPGLTGLWQVSGRSSTSFAKWMELDLHYIDKWSIWLDLKILFKTIPAVMKGSGAV
ncbi:MAG TPA: sugar transferase [Nitrospirales bacterium]|nr:sugar transferase [Nitrospirales bacterium]